MWFLALTAGKHPGFPLPAGWWSELMVGSKDPALEIPSWLLTCFCNGGSASSVIAFCGLSVLEVSPSWLVILNSLGGEAEIGKLC